MEEVKKVREVHPPDAASSILQFPRQVGNVPPLTGLEVDRLRWLLANAERLMELVRVGDLILDPNNGCPVARRLTGR